ncbi:hypothetical protein MXB_4661 [Myxobolus squamalis]|nr:hypothetical protein MXB_4661 [Myxobolus squamalis]
MKDLENKKIWPNNIVLAAAANLLHAKIIVIKTHSKVNHYVDKIEMFEPYSSLWSGKIAIFSLIYPNYYNILLPLPTNNPNILHERERVVNCRDFRYKFIHKFQKKAVKYLLNDDMKSHKKTKSFTNFNTIQAAAQHVYDDHFVKTIFPTYKIASSRFRVVHYNQKEENVVIQGKKILTFNIDETPNKIIFDRHHQ